MVGVASASSPCGPYTYHGSFKPFGAASLYYAPHCARVDDRIGADSRDMGLFKDDDGTVYLLYASDNNRNFKVKRMRELDAYAFR
jgi:hypothetical protein